MTIHTVAAAAQAEPLAESRREQVGWYFYDWANSAFVTTVVTVFLGPYLTSLAKAAADGAGRVYPLGIPVAADSFFSYTVSLSVLLQVVVLPVLGAVADYSQAKKLLMGVGAYIGAFATMAMYFLGPSSYLAGGVLFLIANIGLGASSVFYNAFLPEIASPDRRDAVSSQGWAIGYIGGGLLLLIDLLLFNNRAALGIATDHAVRISLVSAGLWWAVFTIIPLLAIRRRGTARALPGGASYLTIGFSQLWQTMRDMRRFPQTMLFLAAFLLYNDGIQAVITLSSQFGVQELKLDQSVLIGAILMIQFVAFFGALIFGFVARRIGAKKAVMISLVIWTGVVIYSYFMPAGSPLQFYLLGAVIAIVLGGSQALSRSLFSLMIPQGKEAEYFSLYEISDKGTSWLAPLLFGLALQFTGSYRVAIISLMVFFIIGLIVLPFVNVRRAAEEAGNPAPARV